MFAYCLNNPVKNIDISGYISATIFPQQIVRLDFGEEEKSLADYIDYTIPCSIKERERKAGRIYQKTMDAGARGMSQGVDQVIMISGIAFFINGTPGFILVMAGAAGTGFIYGAVHGFVDAVEEEHT